MKGCWCELWGKVLCDLMSAYFHNSKRTQQVKTFSVDNFIVVHEAVLYLKTDFFDMMSA